MINHGGNEVVHGLLAELDKHGDDLASCGGGHSAERGGARGRAGLKGEV